MHQHGFEPSTSCLPGRHTTNCAKVMNLGTKWSGWRSWRFGRIGKKRNTDYDFPPPFTNKIVRAENNEYLYIYISKFQDAEIRHWLNRTTGVWST